MGQRKKLKGRVVSTKEAQPQATEPPAPQTCDALKMPEVGAPSPATDAGAPAAPGDDDRHDAADSLSARTSTDEGSLGTGNGKGSPELRASKEGDDSRHDDIIDEQPLAVSAVVPKDVVGDGAAKLSPMGSPPVELFAPESPVVPPFTRGHGSSGTFGAMIPHAQRSMSLLSPTACLPDATFPLRDRRRGTSTVFPTADSPQPSRLSPHHARAPRLSRMGGSTLSDLTAPLAVVRTWSPARRDISRESSGQRAWDYLPRRGSPVAWPISGPPSPGAANPLPAPLEPQRKQRCTRPTSSESPGQDSSPTPLAAPLATPPSLQDPAETDGSFYFRPLRRPSNLTPKPLHRQVREPSQPAAVLTSRPVEGARQERVARDIFKERPVGTVRSTPSATEGFQFALEDGTDPWAVFPDTPFATFANSTGAMSFTAETLPPAQVRRPSGVMSPSASGLFITPLCMDEAVGRDSALEMSYLSTKMSQSGTSSPTESTRGHGTYSLPPLPTAMRAQGREPSPQARDAHHTRLVSMHSRTSLASAGVAGALYVEGPQRATSPFAFPLEKEPVYPIAIMFMERMNYLVLCMRYFHRWRGWLDAGFGHMSSRRVSSRVHVLNRFLIDSRQVHSGDDTYVCWLPTQPERETYFFVLYPSREERHADISGRLWRMVRAVASFLLITGADPYNLPAEQTNGLILFEVPWRGVSGMDFSNGLTSDGRWSIETSTVLKRCFHSERAMFAFIEGDGVDHAVVLLAATVAAAAAVEGTDVDDAHLEETVTALASPPAPPVPCEAISTNMVISYWGDDTAPHLPHSLWHILSAPDNANELKTIESGLPSWAMFLPQRNIYYRTWLRHVIQWICIVWPIITLIAALIDMYRSYEAIRSVINSIGGFFTQIHTLLGDVAMFVKAVAWALIKPVFEGLWDTMSDWVQSRALYAADAVMLAIGTLEEGLWLVWNGITSFPLFSALAETRAYIVSMLLPFVGDLVVACSSAVRLWVRVMCDAWRVVTGSTTAVWRIFNGVMHVPNWFGVIIQHLVGYMSNLIGVFSYTRRVLPQLMSLVNAQNTATVVQTTADAGVRWAMINSARQAVSGVVTRTYSLTVFIGTEISKHWVTWVQRPLIELFNWISLNSKNILLFVCALFPFGMLSYTFAVVEAAVLDTDTSAFFAGVLVLQDALIYYFSWQLTKAASEQLTLVKDLVQNETLIKCGFSAAVAWISYMELTHEHADKSLNSILLLLVLILLSAAIIYQALGRLIGWLIQRSREASAAAAARNASPSREPQQRVTGRKRKFNAAAGSPAYEDLPYANSSPCLKGSFMLAPPYVG